MFYNLGVIADQKGLYIQTDPPHANLRRDSAELFIKEIIPPLHLTLVSRQYYKILQKTLNEILIQSNEVHVWDGQITSLVCITMTEIMVATTNGHVLRYRWDGTQNRDYNLDLRRVPFCINQQVSKGKCFFLCFICVSMVLLTKKNSNCSNTYCRGANFYYRH